ncbi:hypothetical protein HU200_025296 [Digitaria exilis]|uniref:Peptide transporter n=1 Tax=Digitaria exilis TaxID=1010633 RepID=A0A835C0W0_9POAL|nr:hypothetical protein HU200_025296 [Digitaria exilis]
MQSTLECTGDGSVCFRGHPASKKHTGKWKASSLTIVCLFCSYVAISSISKNLVSYLTNVLHETNVAAARNVSAWQGTSFISPLVGAFMADSYLGKYWTALIFFTIFIVVSATSSLVSIDPQVWPVWSDTISCQHIILFFGLYMVAIGYGGIKPCVSSFGADQFDDTDAVEKTKKGSFFNWFYFCINIGSLISGTVLIWVQENYGYGIGFGIPTFFIALAIGSFFIGSEIYRFQIPGGSPLTRACQVVVAATRKRKVDLPDDSSLLYEFDGKTSAIEGSCKLEHSSEFRFLDKAAVISSDEELSDPWRLCTVTQVEELKVIVGMLPIWATGIVYFSVLAQFSSTFLEQGRTMNTQVVGGFAIPAASLASFDAVSVIFWVPVYDRVLVPAARRLTGNARGLSELQRFGAGLFLSVMVMAAAALVETRRLAVAHAGGEMSILWQIPQYFLVGASVVFACVGQIEFFYNEAPRSMRSLCSALALLTVGLGSYVSSVVVTAVDWLTTRGGGVGWIAEDLDDGHLDRFFWLLAAMSALNLVVFVYCARRYKCKKVF